MAPIGSRIPVSRQERARKRCPPEFWRIGKGSRRIEKPGYETQGRLAESTGRVARCLWWDGTTAHRAPNRWAREAVLWVPYVKFYPQATTNGWRRVFGNL